LKQSYSNSLMIYDAQEKYGVTLHSAANLSVKGTLIVGKNVRVESLAKIIVAENSTLTIGDNVWIADSCHIETSSGSSIDIGCRTTIQSRCQLRGSVNIGTSVLFAPNVFISSGKHLYDYSSTLGIREQDKKYLRDHKEIYSEPVTIDDDCWLGINVVVMPGITVERGCVVGANSVVTKSLSPYSVACGVPARKIKERVHEVSE
ncbi:MAG: acyltransferase, partial [Cyanobacteria bacterium J06576_12]